MTARRRLALLVAPALALLHAARARSREPTPHARFVARAFANRERAIALGDQPYGAVLVRDGEVVADGVSAVVTAGDATAHAEMQALRLAMQRLRTTDLAGTTLYGTSRACAMCESAAAAANVARLYHGHEPSGGDPPRPR